MIRISDEVIGFFEKQGFVIAATIDERGRPHIACKGLVEINEKGEVFLMDLYRGDTCRNLRRNNHLSASAVNEHLYQGYCLKGKGRIVERAEISDSHLESWKKKKLKRTTSRVIRNIQEEKARQGHPEANFPDPKYLIVLTVEEIVDLARYEKTS